MLKTDSCFKYSKLIFESAKIRFANNFGDQVILGEKEVFQELEPHATLTGKLSKIISISDCGSGRLVYNK